MYYIYRDSYGHCSQLQSINWEMTIITSRKDIKGIDIRNVNIKKYNQVKLRMFITGQNL